MTTWNIPLPHPYQMKVWDRDGDPWRLHRVDPIIPGGVWIEAAKDGAHPETRRWGELVDQFGPISDVPAAAVTTWERITETRWRARDNRRALLIRVGDEMRELDGDTVHFYVACCGRCTDDLECVYPLHESEHIRSLLIPAIARQAKTEDEAFDMLEVLVAQS